MSEKNKYVYVVRPQLGNGILGCFETLEQAQKSFDGYITISQYVAWGFVDQGFTADQINAIRSNELVELKQDGLDICCYLTRIKNENDKTHFTLKQILEGIRWELFDQETLHDLSVEQKDKYYTIAGLLEIAVQGINARR